MGADAEPRARPSSRARPAKSRRCWPELLGLHVIYLINVLEYFERIENNCWFTCNLLKIEKLFGSHVILY